MAQVTDEAVKARTGKDWQTWFEILDRAGGEKMTHKEIVAVLTDQHNVGSWWRQSVAVAYEQARGLRQKHQKANGFEISVSRTFSAPVDAAYRAWVTDRERLEWLSGDPLIVTTKTHNKTVRGTWASGPSRIDVYFLPRDSDRVQITVTHSRLDDAEAAGAMKLFWAETLERLRAHLE